MTGLPPFLKTLISSAKAKAKILPEIDFMKNISFEGLVTVRQGRNLLYIDCANRDTLLICAGDSWTWGDSLGRIDVDAGVKDDTEWRTKHIFGSLVANELDCDFINYAIPGANNSEIIDAVFCKILPQIDVSYSKIQVVITLTELCREMIVDPVWANRVGDFNSLEDLLAEYERHMLEALKYYQIHFPNVHTLVARNFTYTFEKNLSIAENHLVNTWVDCLSTASGNHDYPKDLRILSNQGHNPLLAFLKQQTIYSSYKSEFVQLLGQALEAINWLDSSPFNNKSATRHPNEEGHRIWANYILQHLQC